MFQIEWDDRARKELRSIDKPFQKKILKYMKEKVSSNPTTVGKNLTGDKSGLLRYRVEDFRIICKIEHEKLIVLVLRVGHRKNINN